MSLQKHIPARNEHHDHPLLLLDQRTTSRVIPPFALKNAVRNQQVLLASFFPGDYFVYGFTAHNYGLVSAHDGGLLLRKFTYLPFLNIAADVLE